VFHPAFSPSLCIPFLEDSRICPSTPTIGHHTTEKEEMEEDDHFPLALELTSLADIRTHIHSALERCFNILGLVQDAPHCPRKADNGTTFASLEFSVQFALFFSSFLRITPLNAFLVYRTIVFTLQIGRSVFAQTDNRCAFVRQGCRRTSSLRVQNGNLLVCHGCTYRTD